MWVQSKEHNPLSNFNMDLREIIDTFFLDKGRNVDFIQHYFVVPTSARTTHTHTVVCSIFFLHVA